MLCAGNKETKVQPTRLDGDKEKAKNKAKRVMNLVVSSSEDLKRLTSTGLMWSAAQVKRRGRAGV